MYLYYIIFSLNIIYSGPLLEMHNFIYCFEQIDWDVKFISIVVQINKINSIGSTMQK